MDPVVQRAFSPLAMPAPLTSFDGVNNRNGSLPPDTGGDVGPYHYVQWVNLSFQVFDKSGNSLYGPANGNTLWSGFGGPCQQNNNGDPIVLYDSIADRWLMSQFAILGQNGPGYQCIAISQSPDPTGAYYRYAFLVGQTDWNDYPKLGVWPDGYYMSAERFSSNGPLGAMAVVFDRASMLTGAPATFQRFDLPASSRGILPADLDGPDLPPSGSPNYFVGDYYGSTSSWHLWRFHVDWQNAALSTFTGPTNIATMPYNTVLCGNYGAPCVPQPGTSVKLTPITYYPMYRLPYRNMGSYEVLLANNDVNVGNDQAGIRWYEIRDPNGTPNVFQQGTYAPDANHRWMGSIAMDHSGNIALGYSVSSDTVYPSIRYAGRVPSDPPGTLQSEAEIQAGSGSQTSPNGRWGDYSMMTIDPADDCTFWYTQEYYVATTPSDWRTRIGAFKFPSCVDVASPTPIPPSPTSTPTNTPTSTAIGSPTATPICPPAGWSTATSYLTPVFDSAVASQGGMLYSFSGVSNNVLIANAYRYNPAANSWAGIAPLPQARKEASAVSDGTYIYILGGGDSAGAGNPTKTMWRYDPVANSYTAMASFSTATFAQSAAYLNGKIYRIAGCTTPCTVFTNTVEVYTISTNRWASAASYPQAAAWIMATGIGNYVYAAGGLTSSTTSKTYRYDPATNTWNDAATADLPAARWGSAEGLLNGKWVLAGGSTGSVADTAITWDPATNAWSSLPNMPQARTQMSGDVVNSRLYVVGGREPAGTAIGNTDVQVYTNVLCPTATPTSTPFVTSTPTSTRTPTYTATPTPVQCPYTAVVDAYKQSGNTQTFVRVTVSDAFGARVPNAPVSVTISGTTLNATTDSSGKACLTFPKKTGSSVTGTVSVNGPLCYILNQAFTSQSTSPHGCP
jgi:N-acetylneuraminic acid mutarotase